MSTLDPFPQSKVEVLIERYWDDTIDGSLDNLSDIESFCEPFIYTEQLQSQ